ncbi:hypothetical protein BH20ACT5_BH20ACT5_14220 [soil metagenome]
MSVSSGEGTGRNRPPDSGPISVAELLARAGTDQPPSGGRRSASRAPRAPAGPRHRLRRAAIWASAALVAVLVLTAVYYVGLFAYADNTVGRAEALDLASPVIRSPELQAEADNYLLVASGAAGDTIVLVHLSAPLERAVLVDFPADAYVDVPACTRPDGSVTEPYTGRLDSAAETAGAGCTVAAVQLLTGIRVDHYVGVELAGLPAMVDALGGLAVCAPPAAGDPGPAAITMLDGEQAVDFVQGAGQGGRTGAGAAQLHQVITAVLEQALSAGTFVNAIALSRFLTATADSLTLDADTTFGDLKDLGDRLAALAPAAELFLTAPVLDPAFRPTGGDSIYALLDGDLGRSIYESIIRSESLAAEPVPTPTAATAIPTAAATATATPTATASPTATATPTGEPTPDVVSVPPAQIIVDVINGVGTVGLADRAATDLVGLGYQVGQLANEFSAATESIVRHGPGQLDAARTLSAAVPGSVLQEVPGQDGPLQLVVGSSYDGVAPVTIPPPPVPTTAAPTTAAPTAGAGPTSPPVAATAIVGSAAASCS